MKPFQVTENEDKVKEDTQNCRISIDLKKHNWLLKKIKGEKLGYKSSTSFERTSTKRAPKKRQNFKVSLPLKFFHKYLKKNKNMDGQPSLWGIKLIKKPPMSVHAKPFNGMTSRYINQTEIQPPPTENNRTGAEKTVPLIISSIQQNSQHDNTLPKENQAEKQIVPLPQVNNNNENLTNEIILTTNSSNNAVSIVQSARATVPQTNDKESQTDTEIFLSDEDTELLYILKNNNMNKDILLNYIQNASNENNNQPNVSNNNPEVISLVGDEPNELKDQIVIDNKILDVAHIDSEINKTFISLLGSKPSLQYYFSILSPKRKQIAELAVINIFKSYFNLELVKTVDKETQTVITIKKSPKKLTKRPYQSNVDNIATTQSNENINDGIAHKGIRLTPQSPPPPPLQLQPPPPPPPPDKPQNQPSLQQHSSINQQVNQNISAYYSTSTRSQRVPQQYWFRPTQSSGGYGRNPPHMYRANAPQGYPRQSGWYNSRELPNYYGQYGYGNEQYQQPYNMRYPQRWYPQYNNSG